MKTDRERGKLLKRAEEAVSTVNLMNSSAISQKTMCLENTPQSQEMEQHDQLERIRRLECIVIEKLNAVPII